MTFEEINEKYKGMGALGAIHLGKWNGYDVYDAIFPQGLKVGANLMVLIKGDEIVAPEFRESNKIIRELKEKSHGKE